MENVYGVHRPEKTYPKDSFLLSRIGRLVNPTVYLLSFMDIFSRYNQIQMYKLN